MSDSISPLDVLDRLVQALASRRFRVQRELALQDAIDAVLVEEGIAFEREHELSKRDRPDFWVAPIAVEVKVDGSFAEVLRQLHRYAQHESVEGILLVTSRAQHTAGLPETLTGRATVLRDLKPENITLDKPLRFVRVGGFL
jgi:hypothetical protein